MYRIKQVGSTLRSRAVNGNNLRMSTAVEFGTDSKATFINLFKKVKETIFKELMKNMMTMAQ